MSIENGPEKILPKRQLISLVKEYDDLIAESGVAEWADEARASLDQRINNLKEQLDAERMNYTNEQWGLLTQIANFESGYSGFAETQLLGNHEDDYAIQRRQQIEGEKGRLEKRWKEVFGDEPLEW